MNYSINTTGFLIQPETFKESNYIDLNEICSVYEKSQIIDKAGSIAFIGVFLCLWFIFFLYRYSPYKGLLFYKKHWLDLCIIIASVLSIRYLFNIVQGWV